MKKNIGKYLQRAIAKRGMSQRHLAQLIKKPPTQLNKWILNKNEIGIFTLMLIADILKMSLDELVGRERNYETTDHFVIHDPEEPYGEEETEEVEEAPVVIDPLEEIESLREEVEALQVKMIQIKIILRKMKVRKEDLDIL